MQAHAGQIEAEYHVRAPDARDAVGVHELIARCPPLDTNSIYCNLLQCSHHAQTSALAEDGAGTPVGFAAAYRLPERPETLFVWQIAIDERARGRRLARRLIGDILERPACRGVELVQATVTPDNEASRAMFQGLARYLHAAIDWRPLFDSQVHFGNRHLSEQEVTIGPFRLSSSNDKGN